MKKNVLGLLIAVLAMGFSVASFAAEFGCDTGNRSSIAVRESTLATATENGGTSVSNQVNANGEDSKATIEGKKIAQGKLLLTFTGNLESSADGINWTAIDATSPYTVEPAEKKMFFRATSTGQKSNIIEIEISDDSVVYRERLFAENDTLGKSDREILRKFVVNSLPDLISRTEQKFPAVRTQNKLEKQTYTLGDVWTLTGTKEDRIVFYIHGGAWVWEIDKKHVTFCDRLVDALDAKIYMPIYPLAPQVTYKEGYQMVESVYDDLVQQGKPIILMGDSAGGNIALNLVLQLKEKGKSLPEKVVVLAPCADASFSNSEMDEYAKVDGLLPKAECLACARMWAGIQSLKNPILSPLYNDVTGFPDTMFFHGTYDILYPDSKALFDKMCESGVNATFVKGIGFWHVFPIFDIEEQPQLIDLITKFCK